MSITYTPSTNFGAKDSLPTNDPAKVIKGSEFTTEFTAIQTAFGLAAPAASPTFTGTVTISSVDINGGAIDGTTIGGTTPAAGTFSSLTATTADINGGTIDGVTIGGASAGAITGTTITGTSFVSSGDMTFGDNDKVIFGAGSDLQIYHDGSGSYVSDTGTGPLRLQGSGVRIVGTGGENLLIANEAAEVTLLHNNSAKLATTATGIDVTGTVTADGLTVDGTTDLNIGTANIGIDMTSTDEGSYIQIKDNNATGFYFGARAGSFDVYDTDNNAILKANSNGSISFYEDTGTTAKFFWDASAEALGLGTSSVTAKLDILGSQAINGFDVGAILREGLTNTSSSYLVLGDQQGVALRGVHTGTFGRKALAFYTSNNTDSGDFDPEERMRIDASGQVGIGTSSPSSFSSLANNLVVNSSTNSGITISESTGSGSSNILFAATSGFANRGNISYDHSATAMTFGINATERMRIDSSGNVGIGTSSPLSVSGYTFTDMLGSTGAQYRVRTASVDLRMGVDTTNAFLSSTNSSLWFGTNNTEAMRIDSSGRVGIGTSSPVSALDVSQSGDLVTSGLSITRTGANRGSIYLNSSNDTLNISRGNTASIAIDSSGRLGLGTSSPDTLMELVGDNPILTIRDVDTSSSTATATIRFAESGASDTLGNYWDVGYSPVNALTFSLNGSEAMRLDASGRLLVDTTSSTGTNAKLVVGAGLSSTDAVTVINTGDADVTALTLSNWDGAATSFGPRLSFGNSGRGSFTIGGSDGANNFDICQVWGTPQVRVDSSGNLLVGKTATNTLGTVGHDFGGTGYAMHTRASSNVLYLNRTTNDGNIVEFYKDGSSVGSIGADAGYLTIGKGDTGLLFQDGGDAIQPRSISGLANRDAAIDLGVSGGRFKDLYLSGGVYLGGTGAANKLEDYEEGTSAADTGGLTANYTFTSKVGVYTKIGDTVIYTFRYEWTTTNTGSGDTAFGALPFTATADGYVHITECTANVAADQIHGRITSGTSAFKIYGRNNASATQVGPAQKTAWGASNVLAGTAIYKA